VLASPDEARLARAVACVNFLAGVPDDMLAGRGIDGALLDMLMAVLRNPADESAVACSKAPGGRAEWTMQLLADKLVELGVVDAVSDETVRRAMKKTP
jgi:hypothetical protein